MNATTILKLAAVLLTAAAVTPAAAETYRISSDGASLVVTTRHLEARFDGPDIVRLKNLLTGETYTHPSRRMDPGLARVKIKTAGAAQVTQGLWRMAKGSYGAHFESSSTSVQLARYALHVTGQDAELVLRCKATLNSTGAYAISWGVNNLSLNRTSTIFPARAGRILTAQSLATSGEFDYPIYWEAQFVVLDGRKGSVCIYSTDQDARFKRLSFLRSSDTFQLVFETENQAPFDELRDIQSVEWRINCFDSDWRAAVTAYKEEMHKRGDLYRRPQVVENQTWPREIKGTVRVGDFTDTGILDELARHVVPGKTLLYFANWRKDGYDVNYPDYTGVPNTKNFTRHAQKLGFKVMFHVDLPGVTSTNPVFEQVKQYQLKEKISHNPMGWLWDKGVPQRFAFINPAASEYRKIFVDAMKGITADYGPDALHLDVSAPMWNDANGLIEGMNYCQGSVQLHRDLLAALPRIVLVGESINELLAPFEHFAQRWAWDRTLDSHPVCEFLFGDLVKSYGYLGQPNPDSSPTSFTEYVRSYEPQGVLPNAVVDRMEDMGPDRPGLMRCFRVIREYQRHNLRPDWSKKWPEKVLFAMIGDGGVKAAIERTESGVRMVRDGKVIYERAQDVLRARTSGHIAGHWAYAPGEIFGLDAAKSYWIDPGPPDFNAPHVSVLKGNVIVEECRVTDDLVSFRFAGPGFDPDIRAAEIALTSKPRGVITADEPVSAPDAVQLRLGVRVISGPVLLEVLKLPFPASVCFYYSNPHPVALPLDLVATSFTAGLLMNGAYTSGSAWGGGTVYADTVDGVSHPAINGHPPASGRTILTWLLKLPASHKARLLFTAGIRPNAATGGVGFIVRVNGVSKWTKSAAAPGWWKGEVDLSEHVGEVVVLELITDSAGDPNCDWATWVSPRIERLDSLSPGGRGSG